MVGWGKAGEKGQKKRQKWQVPCMAGRGRTEMGHGRGGKAGEGLAGTTAGAASTATPATRKEVVESPTCLPMPQSITKNKVCSCYC